MRVIDVIERKGALVHAIAASRPLSSAVDAMARYEIGSVVVLDDVSGRPIGVIAEPDVVAALKQHGAKALRLRLRAVMRSPAPVCAPNVDVAAALETMTRRRIRYLLVERDGETLGLVSIGDLVKARLEHTDLEARVLRDVARSCIVAHV